MTCCSPVAGYSLLSRQMSEGATQPHVATLSHLSAGQGLSQRPLKPHFTSIWTSLQHLFVMYQNTAAQPGANEFFHKQENLKLSRITVQTPKTTCYLYITSKYHVRLSDVVVLISSFDESLISLSVGDRKQRSSIASISQ